MVQRCCLVLAYAVLALMSTVHAQNKELPPYIQVCHRHDPELNECITNAVEEMRPILKTGGEGFIPSLEPLYIREVVVTEGAGFKITGKDLNAYGASEFKLYNVQGNMDTLIFDFDLDFDMLYVEAKYDVSGKILLIPIRGNGPLTGNFSDITVHVKLTAELIDEKFVKFNGLDIKLNVGKGVLKLENLFGGDKVLGDVVNAAINANFAQILKELGHPLEKALGEVLMEISNDAVDGLTIDQLSPL